MLGQHPLIATRADTGEVLHVRHRKGSANSGRGAQRFVRETVGRVRRAGASGQLTLRADSAFHSKYVIAACRDHDVRYSITVNLNKAVVRAIEAIDEADWTPIAYTLGGKAEVAEASYGDDHRLVVRRTRLVGSRPSCSPRGATTPSSATSKEPRSPWTKTIMAMPSSNWPSGTSKKVPGSSTARPATSTPTRPGQCWQASPTT